MSSFFRSNISWLPFDSNFEMHDVESYAIEARIWSEWEKRESGLGLERDQASLVELWHNY